MCVQLLRCRRSIPRAIALALAGTFLMPIPGASAKVACPVTGAEVPDPIEKDTSARLGLKTLVGSGQGLVAPNSGSRAPGDDEHLFVADTVGRLWVLGLNDGSRNLVLDLSGVVDSRMERATQGFPDYEVRGLFGVAFHPGFRSNGLLYTLTAEPHAPGATFPLQGAEVGPVGGNLAVISEWQVDPGSNPPKVSGGRRIVLSVELPEPNHNAGSLSFGRDRLLYFALGDGGSFDEAGLKADAAAPGNGKDRSSVLGKILRIDPSKRSSANGQYGVPRGNPYAKKLRRGGAAGCAKDELCDEIWATGFNNPYRFAFDRRRGTLLVGDAGPQGIQEVDVVHKGRNYGSGRKAGTFYLRGETTGRGQSGCDHSATGLIDPLAQFSAQAGHAVVGGFVYRGRALPELVGDYVFADSGFATASGEHGRLLHFRLGTRLNEQSPPLRQIHEFNLDAGMAIYGFAEDADGELYVLGSRAGLPAGREAAGHYGEDGVILKLVPASLVDPAASPTPASSPDPSPIPAATPSASPGASPGASPAASPSASPTASPLATAGPTPAATPLASAPGTPAAGDPTPPAQRGAFGTGSLQIGTAFGLGLYLVDPLPGEASVQGMVTVTAKNADVARIDNVTMNGVELEVANPPPNGAGNLWRLSAGGPQPTIGNGGWMVLVATGTTKGGDTVQRTLVLPCAADIALTATPAAGGLLAAGTALNLTSPADIVLNRGFTALSQLIPAPTLRLWGYEPASGAISALIQLAAGDLPSGNPDPTPLDVTIPAVPQTTSPAYLLELRWPGQWVPDGDNTGAYCGLAKRLAFISR